ncbi:hypothetical protein FEM48_Zijuj07G0070000 [Ziziphus jujuba var. spinosa]|uniref:Peptidoglycan binding-like domain-containing protein n=1 Tax=Ziziphus jujuba var. spinosa TaxID=714518 RepID=A0A978V361_ZIZJJ|nr:hypothetical protein FEM48_Zijuj07G0070000 [Ziziphus jujuba var. spinosa]
MSSSLILFLNPPIHHQNKPLPFSSSISSSSSFSHSLSFNSHVCFSSFSSSHSDREEQQWLREEQRWLREEQRWLREEQRWARERDSLLRQISDLQFRIQALERQLSVQEGASVSETIASIAGLLQVLKDKSLIAETGLSTSTSTSPMEALLKLGFYSGEEDMEFSSFSSGTERAVKTWQASLGAPEDGIMTEQLLERLFVEQIGGSGSNLKTDRNNSPVDTPKEGTNGAAIASFTEISKVQQKIVKDEGVAEVDLSHQRVFLLGENRWEEPSRLGRYNKNGESKTKQSTTKCLSCRGEGRLLCMECDGTGEPNIEPQFLEWVDEGAKCPYCDGLGYTICDVCEGKSGA